MRVLGIDPGPKESAYCLWDGMKILACEKIPNHSFEMMLFSRVTSTREEPNIVACEHLQCFGMAVGKEVFETAYWIGEYRCTVRGVWSIPFIPVYRSEVKQHFCHTARATDSNIRVALEDRFGPKGTKKTPGLMYPLVGSDMRSAFAIAVMVYDRYEAEVNTIETHQDRH